MLRIWSYYCVLMIMIEHFKPWIQKTLFSKHISKMCAFFLYFGFNFYCTYKYSRKFVHISPFNCILKNVLWHHKKTCSLRYLWNKVSVLTWAEYHEPLQANKSNIPLAWPVCLKWNSVVSVSLDSASIRNNDTFEKMYN